jgi:hypothetical protein
MVVPMAARPATQAAMAKMVSSGLNAGAAATGAGRGAAGRAAWAAATAAGAATGAAPGGRGAATGAAMPGGRGAAGAGAGTPPGAPVGPPGGRVGSLMVGAADGLGGKVIRTVSFLGWTFPVDFFMGVTGAPGTPGGTGGCGLSAICFKINPAGKLSNQIPKDSSNSFDTTKEGIFNDATKKASLREIAGPPQKIVRAKTSAVHDARRENRCVRRGLRDFLR